ncbi:MAG TPA: hypothetical protein VKQ11_00345, partial [Candidatus Sulfotelmatobacter sp.]|nr:hypothetical protein [Candidatus Sulfotelmatobacter sp.]
EPGEPNAHYQLGRLYQALGRKADAERELRTTRELQEKADQDVASHMPIHAPDVKPVENQ